MQKNAVLFIGLIILSILGFGIYSLIKTTPKSIEELQTAQENSSQLPTSSLQTENTQSSSSKYIDYSKSALYEARLNSRRVLFFYANWCPTCKPSDQEFKTKPDLLPEDVRVIRVNYNDSDTDAEEKELAKKYAVTYQHTFVQIDGSDNEVTKWNGGKIDELLKNIK